MLGKVRGSLREFASTVLEHGDHFAVVGGAALMLMVGMFAFTATGASADALTDAENAIEALVTSYTPIVMGVAITIATTSLALVLIRWGLRRLKGV